ncbi:helicase Cas3 [Streptomyces acidiscabies]|nr:helicase Cas3 [Streptomyces acidiscabies]GAV38332.1 helicase Cas3 [Streptomyces acidiscabies]
MGGSGGVLIAHSRSDVSGQQHSLEAHLRGSAALARKFGEVFGVGELAEYLALVHDVGKGSCAWQDGLRAVERRGGGKVGVRHKHAGTVLAKQYTHTAFSAVVFGHHGGLPSLESLKTELTKTQRGGEYAGVVEEAVRAVERVVPEIRPQSRLAVPGWLRGLPKADGLLGMDLLVRMLFSCVVDADFLDTAAHFGDGVVRLREPVDMGVLLERYEARRAELLARRAPSPVDAVRESVYGQACAAASGEPGVYVLHVPTGGAKTMAAGAFALRHAAAYGKRRVVMAVPYISITEQNAAVYRQLLDPEPGSGQEAVVLEHHSSVDLDLNEKSLLDGVSDKEREEWERRAHAARLAAENWDAPFVVTTTVRLFESLFSHKPSQMRRLHHLAGSVIVLDEVQSLPDGLLVPILSVLRGLVEHFGVTVLLASATQPSFWDLPRWQGLERKVIVEDPSALFTALRRVTYEWRTGDDVTLESIATEAAGHRQVLTVVATTKDAARFHRHLDERAAEGEVLHLSTRMTGAHRREVIARIKELLASGEAVQVVSTSLIEAGVDLDFPRVYRAWAPAESMQQAAGRCNRDGHLDSGIVVIFRPTDGHQPKSSEYNAAVQATNSFFGPDRAFPDDLKALEKYYPDRYAMQAELGEQIEDFRCKLNFPEVDRLFQMVEDGHSVPVVVIRREEDREKIEAAVAQLQNPVRPCGPEVLRGLQQHTASLPRGEAEQALRSGLAVMVTADLILWLGAYHEQRGLDPDEPEDRTAFTL